MVQLKNDRGEINISNEVISSVTGAAAMNCYGVRGMALRKRQEGIVFLLMGDTMSKGVKVDYHDEGDITISLHIIVIEGINFVTVCQSIIREVSYRVKESTGVSVRRVNIFIDSVEIG